MGDKNSWVRFQKKYFTIIMSIQQWIVSKIEPFFWKIKLKLMKVEVVTMKRVFLYFKPWQEFVIVISESILCTGKVHLLFCFFPKCTIERVKPSFQRCNIHKKLQGFKLYAAYTKNMFKTSW